ncbi:hypothetical protein EMPS_03785 [Entomortierella parvispora]|uniref:ACB domain-containing protein n=1 Tax=Entomortierella parvispora TaxID=205924 RepID=A0A9P3H7H5_9FUNG|nr:hypothetical protein EMPS_03785 [Entomortierella parvispora]
MAATSPSSGSPSSTFPPSFSPTSPSSPHRPLSQAAVRSRSPPLTPLPALSTTVPGLTPFDRAVHVVNASNRAIADTHTLLNSSTGSSSSSSSSNNGSDVVSFTPEDQLLLYGAYKQATKGDVRGLKPAFFEIAARSKWQAWANMRGKTTKEAEDTYVELVVSSLTKPGSHPDHHQLAEEITQRPSRSSSPTFSSINTEKELPPIIDQIAFSSASSPSPVQTSSSPSLRPSSARKGSLSQSIRSTATGGLQSAATSVYELASENIVDSEAEDNNQALNETTDNDDQGYREITETVVEEEILDDEAYEAEVQKSRPVSVQVAEHRLQEKEETGKDNTVEDADEHDEKDDDEQDEQSEEDDEDEDEDDDDDDDDDDVYQSSEEYDASEQEERIMENQLPYISPTVAQMPSPPSPHRQDSDVKEFIDEGVFDAEDEDEDIKEEGAHTDIKIQIPTVLQDSRSDILAKESAELKSPRVEPYRVFALHDATNASESPATLASLNDTQNQPVIHHSASAPSLPQASSMEGLVCPVSKKTASSGAMCPAAMFAQARAASATAPGIAPGASPAIAPAIEPTQHQDKKDASNESTDLTQPSGLHQRSATEPASKMAVEPTRPTSSSAVNAATSQGKRIGQGIVSRFTALRSSLAAASARAASSALSGGSSSGVPKNPNAVVVKDQVTNQSVTVVCPHLVSTQQLETEVVRLQTDISVLHERLDLLQESLKIKSQTQALERRSARGILKLILRQGLINAVLLLIVFAVLYKRKSPIAFAILAYVGQGRKEGEAGWRALMRWTADLVRRGQRNQQYVLNAGRRNGYW